MTVIRRVELLSETVDGANNGVFPICLLPSSEFGLPHRQDGAASPVLRPVGLGSLPLEGVEAAVELEALLAEPGPLLELLHVQAAVELDHLFAAL